MSKLQKTKYIGMALLLVNFAVGCTSAPEEKPAEPEIESEELTEPEVEPELKKTTEIEDKPLPSEPPPFTIKIEKPPDFEPEVKPEDPSTPSEPESTKTVPELGKLLGLDFRRDSDAKKLEKEEKKEEEEKSDPELSYRLLRV